MLENHERDWRRHVSVLWKCRHINQRIRTNLRNAIMELRAIRRALAIDDELMQQLMREDEKP